MLRFAVILALLFLALGVLRLLRVFAVSLFAAPRRRESEGEEASAELVRDPVCGTWVDRRLALTVSRAGKDVPVCSEKCRVRLLEAG